MDAGAIVVGIAVVGLLVCTMVGGPMALVEWVRTRRAEVIARQIALTEALDGRLGPIIAPVVTKPLFGPWEVRIAVPLLRSTLQARMLAVIDDVFADVEATALGTYRVILAVAHDPRGAEWENGPRRPEKRWAGTPVGAA